MNITEKLVKSLTPPRGGNVIHYDDDIPGFGVRITAQGSVAFVLNYRVNSRERRFTIGKYPVWSALAARDEAKLLRRAIDDGQDPMAEREAAAGEPLVADLADKIMQAREKKKRAATLRNDRSMLDTIILPKLGRMRVSAVGQRDIESLHGSLKATPYRANRVLALLSSMFNTAIEWKWLQNSNPCKGVERYHEDRRETWLNGEQLTSLSRALDEYPDQNAADAVRLLITTGAREGEVLHAEWSQFDLKRGVWTKPSHHTKQRKIEHTPLGRAAMMIVAKMAANKSDDSYLFPGQQGARVTLRRPWIQVLKAAGLAEGIEKRGKRRHVVTVWKPKVRVHDLRHTFASHLVSHGESLYTVGRLLGHTLPSTTARYAHVDDTALRETANVFQYPRLRK